MHDVGENERAQPYLVLELADRGDLRSRRRAADDAGRRPTVDELGRVADALAAAMEILHAAQVVHRDLAPGNLLLVSPDATSAGEVRGAGILADEERVVVGDLGLSKDLARTSGLTVGTGTAGFTPPEQRAAGAWVDVRADIWSASALLVWLATGDAPTDDGAWRGELAGGGWPAPLADALDHGLETDPQDRPPTAAHWRAAVSAGLAPPLPAPAPVAATPALEAGSDRPSLPTRPRARRRTVLAAVAALALGAAGVGAGWALRHPDTPSTSRTDLGGGRARVAEQAHGVRLAVTGPSRAKVGEAVRFRADVDGTTSAYWITGDGRSYPSTSQVEVTPRSEGRATIVLVARDDLGRVVDVTFGFDVAG